MTLAEVDAAIRDCAARMRLEQARGDADRWFEDAAELDRLLDERLEMRERVTA